MASEQQAAGEGKTDGEDEGTIAVCELPPHRGLIINLCFYRVKSSDSPAPHGGHPPPEAATDCYEVFKQVDLDAELAQAAYDLPFRIERPPGYYYLQVRAILFRTQSDKVLAQAEQFFFGQRPAYIGSSQQGALTLPVAWPSLALEDLGHYGTVRPQTTRPWWRFW